MKIVAHPMVVAVALGLVGPSVLEERLTDADRSMPCEETVSSTSLFDLDAEPSHEDFARVEAAWSEIPR